MHIQISNDNKTKSTRLVIDMAWDEIVNYKPIIKSPEVNSIAEEELALKVVGDMILSVFNARWYSKSVDIGSGIGRSLMLGGIGFEDGAPLNEGVAEEMEKAAT